MKKMLALAATAVALVTLVPAANAASFNCTGRLTVTEAVICQNPRLSALDSRLATYYFSNLRSVPRSVRPAARSEQAGWLRRRNGCGANIGCLTASYKDRINDFVGE